MKRLVILGIWSSLGAVSNAPIVSLATLNKEADAAFLAWRISPDAEISQELKDILKPDVQAFIVDQGQLPFDRVVPKEELVKKVEEISDALATKYPIKENVRYELDKIIKQVIVPEYLFQQDPNPITEEDKHYNVLLRALSGYRTRAQARLDIWALRYLTSEAQFVVLSVITQETLDGRSFNQLDVPGKIKVLETAAELVTRQFMENLKVVQGEYKFNLPPYTSVAVKNRVMRFLREKFGL